MSVKSTKTQGKWAASGVRNLSGWSREEGGEQGERSPVGIWMELEPVQESLHGRSPSEGARQHQGSVRPVWVQSQPTAKLQQQP